MGTIADKLNNILECKADIKSAIEEQGVTVGDAPLSEYAGKIEQISGGGAEEAPENDVNFYDYDGFRVASYTIDEAKALTELPTPPSHEGLVFQEWNWSLSDLTSYNRRYADIGANYITTDGKTHLFVTITDTNEVFIMFRGYNGTLSVDWGDNSTASSLTFYATISNRAVSHTYSTAGDYKIVLEFTQSDVSGFFGLYSTNNSNNFSTNIILKEVNCGNYFTLNTGNSLSCILPLLKVSISTGTDCNFSSTFYYSIVAMIAPPRGTFFNVSSALYIVSAIICLPASTSDYSQLGFQNCTTTKIIVPECTDSTKRMGQYALISMCHTRIISLPSSFQFANTTANNWFGSCPALEYLDIVQGWIPNANIRLDYSTRWGADNMVAFFNKLGTTQTAITLTFGSTNLGKLTSDEKAIATNKGYTLA